MSLPTEGKYTMLARNVKPAARPPLQIVASAGKGETVANDEMKYTTLRQDVKAKCFLFSRRGIPFRERRGLLPRRRR